MAARPAYGQAVANLMFPPQRDFVVPANCGGSPSVGCVGGVPVDPPATIHAAASNVVATEAVGQSRFDVTATLGITGSVPVTIPIVGDCTLTIDTSAGANPAAQVNVPVNFLANAAVSGGYDITIGDVSVTGVTSDDFNLGSSFACRDRRLRSQLLHGLARRYARGRRSGPGDRAVRRAEAAADRGLPIADNSRC